MSARTHDSHFCPCDLCRWANEVQARQLTTSRREHLQQLRKSLVEEIDRLHVELNRIDDEYDKLEDAN